MIEKEVDWMDAELISHNDSWVYSLDKAKEKFEVAQVADRGWVVVKTDGPITIDFAVFEFSHSDADDSNIMMSHIFHGTGPSGGLRECRHTYWGENGYVFFPDAEIISKALEFLKKYFDMD